MTTQRVGCAQRILPTQLCGSSSCSPSSSGLSASWEWHSSCSRTLGQKEWLLDWIHCKSCPAGGKHFFQLPFFCFPLKDSNNKILLLHNYGIRDQTVLKMQKVPYIQTAVAQKKHPLQDLSKPFNSFLPLMYENYKKQHAFICYFLVTLCETSNTPGNLNSWEFGLIPEANQPKNFINTNLIFIFLSATNYRFTLYNITKQNMGSPNLFYELGQINQFYLSVKFKRFILINSILTYHF